jgi:hypothetical protein
VIGISGRQPARDKKKEQLLPRCRNLPVFKETLGQTSKHREIFEIFARFD